MYLLLVLAVVACVASGEKYTTRYDNINIDNILRNDRILNNYYNCLMDRGSCSPDARELKTNLPEALENNCANCSLKQKEVSEKVFKYLYENNREMYNTLVAKWDPENKYRAKYKERANTIGVNMDN